ncbi:MAG TPA: DUF5069 domain-containing protein [Lacunisphaera sp.]|nr:DUF5069 domain-containing protein [Lacunisphaera sp.]
MPAVPGLRSPYVKVGRLVYFGRMLDKIRLHAAGRLPAEYAANLGDEGAPNFFDARCCRFLGVRYRDLREHTLAGGSDAAVLAWAEAHGAKARTDEECEVWNMFMSKRGWRDAAAAGVRQRIEQFGLAGKPVETMFDVLDYDEGRDPGTARPWEGM